MADTPKSAVSEFKKNMPKSKVADCIKSLEDFLGKNPNYDEMMEFWLAHGAEIYILEKDGIGSFLFDLLKHFRKND